MMKGLSPDKSAGRRRVVKGLKKNLLTSPRQGRKDRGERYDNGPLGPTPAQAGMLLRRGWFGRLREGFVPNIEMWELEKEMDKDGRVVFRLGWATR